MNIKKIIIVLSALILLTSVLSGAVSAITLFPSTDVREQDSNLQAGDTLYLITAPNIVIKLLNTTDGKVYFTDNNLVAGTYSKDIGGITDYYVLSYPDVTIKISL
ncbi:MAG: hypothetical protein Q4Q53_00340, partial [Methanocorpusculum sp.]|nr:hypothetical protein [Methanocorpusculum sp.]